MPPVTHASRPSTLSSALARDRLGVATVVFFILSAAAPFTVMGGVVPTGWAVTGLTGTPIAFLAVAAILALFSVGYVAMARHVANAGAFYTYVARGLGRPLGVGAAWVALVAYNALQVGLYGAFGAILAPLLQQWFGVTTYWWLLALAAWALVAVLGLRSVDVNGTVLAGLLVAEVTAIVVFSLANAGAPVDGLTFGSVSPDNLAGAGAGALLSLAVLGFVGFEQSVVFSEEAKDPRRTVRLATFVSIGLIAALYAFGSWAIVVAIGEPNVVERARAEGPELLFNLAGANVGGAAVHAGHALFATSLLAAMISFHNTTARYAFALGREGVLPRALGRTSRSTGSPMLGSIVQSAVGLAVILTFAGGGWDPLVQLFFWGGTSGGLGVLLLITTTALAVPVYFARHPDAESVWRRLVAPVLALAALLTVSYLAWQNIATLLGVEPGSTLTWTVPTVYAATAAAGVGWALILKARNPSAYDAIGLGAAASSTRLGLTLTDVDSEEAHR